MKATFTLLALMIFGSAFAWDNTRLTVTVPDFGTRANGQQIQLQVDNRYYPLTNNELDIATLQPGRHIVRLVKSSRRGGNGNGNGGYGNNSQNGVLIAYTVTLRNNYHTDVVISRFGRVLADERPLNSGYTNDPWGDPNWGSNNGYGNGGSGSGGGNGNGGYGPGSGNGGYGQGNGGNNNSGYGNNGYNSAMSDATFNSLLSMMRKESFDNTKLTLAKDALASNRVTVAQVKQMISLFSFDKDKLDLAKAAYPRTADRNNYFLVNESFDFSNTKEQLSAWLRTQ
jgi:hypothetical protein